MKRIFSFSISLVFLFFATIGYAQSCNSAADTVLYGNIITMDEANPHADAIAIKDGIIVYVGNKENVKGYIGAKTTSLNYQDNYIYPGFVDGHNHIGIFATMELDGASLVSGALRLSTDIMKKHIAEHPGLEVYKGMGFWYVPGDPDELNHEVLDKYTSDKYPVVMVDSGGHSALLNKKAIEYFNIKKLLDVYGTDGIKVDKNGEPTGYLVETPRFDIMEQIPISKQKLKDFIVAKQYKYIKQGYTALCDAAIVETEKLPMVSAYKELAAEGKLKLKVRALCEIADIDKDPLKEVERIAKLASTCNDDYFKIIGIKIFIDGVPEALTSWTNNPYTADAQKGDNYYGYIRWNNSRKEELTSIIKLANEKGLLVHMHTMGEAATSYALDCFEKARQGTPADDARNGLAHVSYVEDGDYKRFAKNKIIAFVAPHWSSWKVFTYKNEIKIYGEKKARKMYPIKSFADNGVKMSFHTDGMCNGGVPEMVYSAVTRKSSMISQFHFFDPYFPQIKDLSPEEIRGEKEKIKAHDALKCLTINPAYSMKEEKHLGCIKTGMAADFTVYDTDLSNDAIANELSCNNAKLLSIFSSGKLVYPFNK